MGHVIEDLTAVIEARKAQPPAGSYTAQLFAKGENEMLKKLSLIHISEPTRPY